MDFERFTKLEEVLNQHGGKAERQAAATLRAEWEKYQAAQATHERLQAELQGIPGQAVELAAQGKPTAQLVGKLGSLQAEASIAGAVVEGSSQRVESAWINFQEVYRRWSQAELARLEAEARQLVKGDLAPAVRALVKTLDSMSGRLAELQDKAGVIAQDGETIKQAPQLAGLATLTGGLAHALAVRLGLEPQPVPLRSNAPESRAIWGPIANISDRALVTTQGESAMTPADVALLLAAFRVIDLPRSAREPLES